MPALDMEDSKRKVKSVITGIQKSDWESAENSLLDIVIHISKSHQELADTTPRNHDIAALIHEMRRGFESMDKRFDDLIHQMDKRFEQVDKRFEQVDKRFSMMFWIMAMGFTFFTFIITHGTFFKN